MESNLQEHSPNQSDSDDWTLVSFKAPVCPSNSTTRSQELETEDTPENLIEVDLEQSSDSSFDKLNEELTSEEQHRISNDLVVPGFQALDTTSDGEISQPESRRSSVSRSDLVSNETDRNLGQFNQPLNTTRFLTCCTDTVNSRPFWRDEEFDEAEDTETEERGLLYDFDSRQTDSDRVRSRRDEQVGIIVKSLPHILTALLVMTLCHFILEIQKSTDDASSKQSTKKLEMEFSRYSDNSDINISPKLYAELHALDQELSRCVERQSPSWYKYYTSEERFKDFESKPQPFMKHYNSLVCYGQETQWRARFNKLKEQKSLDLSKIMLEAKRAVANDLLGFYHPSLQFKLILNQLEYLEFLENKRNKKQSDETIKYLKVENMQLYRQINNPSKSGSTQKVDTELERENFALKRQLDALKTRMNIKAGPSYIRQSQELEQYEKENVLLKQFLYDISKGVSVISQQFNLYTVDAPINLNNLEVLKFHTKMTKEYIGKLNKKISDILVENMDLKEELGDHFRLTTVNKSISTVFHEDDEPDSFIMKNNNSDVLMADNCMRNLLRLREQAELLENENKYLRRCCSKDSSQSLATHQDSSLNLTKKIDQQVPTGIHRQIAALATGLEKRIRNAIVLAGSRSFDELSLFLEEFSNRIKSTSLVPKESFSLKQDSVTSRVLPKLIDENSPTTTPKHRKDDSGSICSKDQTMNIIEPVISQESNSNTIFGMVVGRESFLYDLAVQRKSLQNVKYVKSEEFQPKAFKYISSNYQPGRQQNTKHTFVNSKINKRKLKKRPSKNSRKLKSQKYSRSGL